MEVDGVHRDVVNLCFRMAQQLKSKDGKPPHSFGQGRSVDQLADLREGAAVRMRVAVLVFMRVCMFMRRMAVLMLVRLMRVRMLMSFRMLVPVRVRMLGCLRRRLVPMRMRVLVRMSCGFGMRMAVFMRLCMLPMLVRVRVLMRVAVRCFPLGRLAVLQYMHLDSGDAAAVHGFHPERSTEAERRRCFFEHTERHPGLEERAEKHIAGDAGEAVEIGKTHRETSGGKQGVAGYVRCVQRVAGAMADSGSTAFMEPER